MKTYLLEVVHLCFSAYMILLFVRIILSWIPPWQEKKWAHFIAFYTDPFLNLFRRIIPPLGGTLDLSPLLAFFALRILEAGVLWAIRAVL